MQDRFNFRYCYNGTIYDVFAVDFINATAQLVSLDRKERLLNGIDLDIDIGKLIQCTGLKDKNGKLIYESDIVKYEDEVYGLCIGKIEWDNAHYELQYYTGEKYGWFSHILCLKYIKNIEIIGNIYENEELLTGAEN